MIEIDLNSVYDSDSGKCYMRVQSMFTPPNENLVDEHMNWKCFEFYVDVIKDKVLIKENEFGVVDELTKKEIAQYLKIELSLLTDSDIEDFIREEMPSSDYIYADKETINW
jgi:hypothetical protein